MHRDQRHSYVDHVQGVVGGKAIVKGTRIGVWEIAESYKSGMTAEEILDHYPQLTLTKVFDALGYWDDNRDEVEADISANRHVI